MKSTVKYVVHGHVQGVGYRYFVYKKAGQLNLSGYAKNLYDGTVEVIAQGTSENVFDLFVYLQEGPSRSNVERVTRETVDEIEVFKGFSIK